MGNGLYLKVGIALLASLIISFISTPIVKQFAHRVGAIDVPDDNRRVHDHPIPRMGGLAIFLGFILSVVLFADVTLQVRGILLGSLLVVIVGVIDDIVPLPAWLKFLLQIVAAFIAVFFTTRHLNWPMITLGGLAFLMSASGIFVFHKDILTELKKRFHTK